MLSVLVFIVAVYVGLGVLIMAVADLPKLAARRHCRAGKTNAEPINYRKALIALVLSLTLPVILGVLIAPYL